MIGNGDCSSRRTEAERPQARHFREQREEQVVFPPVVRRVLIVGRTDRPRLRNCVEISGTDARVGQGQVHCRSSCRLGAEKVAEFDKHIYLAMKRHTAGIAREIVDTSKTAGEAWYRLTDRFYGRNVQGATAIASQLQELKRPTQIAERDQEVGQRICSTVSKRTDAQHHRQSGLFESGPRDPPAMEDKVFAFIRNNTSSAAPMDIGKIAPGQTPTPGLGSSSQSTKFTRGFGQLPRSEQLWTRITMGTRLERW